MSLRVAFPLLSASLQGCFPVVAAGVGAGAATDVVSTIKGVQRVVRLFEYLD